MTSDSTASKTLPGDLQITRTFNAPRELVFRVWTEPEHLKQWWGPRGFTNPVCRFDARPGGEIYIDMQGPDGTIYPMNGEVREITPPERLVFHSAALNAAGQPELEVLTTLVFVEEAGRTTVTLQAEVLNITEVGKTYRAGMEEGWGQSLDKLEEYIATQA